MKKSKKHIMIFMVLVTIVVSISVYFIVQSKQADDVQHDVDTIKEQVIDEPEDDFDDNSNVDKWLRRKVDFNELQAINSDVSTWLFVPDTNIDSYVMQEPTLNQYYYDHRNIYKNYVYSGSYLIPKEPLDDVQDAHQLILGHNMRDGLQFSRLKQYYGAENNGLSYKYVYTYHPDHSQRWKVWTVCDLKDDDMVYELPYELGTKHYSDLIDHMETKGRYQLCDKPDNWTQTLMLSTCNRWNYYVLARLVVVCVPDVAYYYAEDKEVSFEKQHKADMYEMQQQEDEQLEYVSIEEWLE